MATKAIDGGSARRDQGSGTAKRRARADKGIADSLGSEAPGKGGKHHVAEDRLAAAPPEEDAGEEETAHGRRGERAAPKTG